MNYKLELENATWNSVANHRFWNAFRFGTLERVCWAVRTMCTVCLVTKRCVWHVTLCVCIYMRLHTFGQRSRWYCRSAKTVEYILQMPRTKMRFRNRNLRDLDSFARRRPRDIWPGRRKGHSYRSTRRPLSTWMCSQRRKRARHCHPSSLWTRHTHAPEECSARTNTEQRIQHFLTLSSHSIIRFTLMKTKLLDKGISQIHFWMVPFDNECFKSSKISDTQILNYHGTISLFSANLRTQTNCELCTKRRRRSRVSEH